MSEQNTSVLPELKLGKATEYIDRYDPTQLQAVPRKLMRDKLPKNTQAFLGVDIWTGYEISWLLPSGKPVVYIGEFIFSANSSNIVESKSFKLYLNSFNQSKFDSIEDVVELMQNDLTQCCGAPVEVKLYPLGQFAKRRVTYFAGQCIDNIDVEITRYDYAPNQLQLADSRQIVEETLVSHLLKSNCLVTGQPDWASIEIYYQGQAFDHASVLKYLIGFRNHNEFHEHCVERIFRDLETQLRPDKLSVYARYTRRGGLDINPLRVSHMSLLKSKPEHRLVRQ
ncbi:7-cyano-7-deazaguanine reductase [Catenovulum agarivorans DS-2]|uniref:NADPH-dependent 7-cyano-7-deazaguanine reductase n=1 Tax=Catenovulum agarivorans DS-2 TaxID=1328313 RepID=W7QSC9_9ALTE|nr:NADPH-dependent 7-cyano-7-deazaguanine reductase QueF [Catenovulum agarivorans]EWH11927.1 7-cyano-7-deazaguanine reductase [Catenovulum agarivorans DS-2]